jgi:hypothetical protein
MSFFKKWRTGGQNSSCLGTVPVGGGRHKERVREGECGRILCTHVCKWNKGDLLKLFQEWGEGG